MTNLTESMPARSAELREKVKITRERVVGGLLGSAAVIAVKGQHTNYYWGYGERIPDIAEAAANSMAHPFVGFIGAAVGVTLASRRRKKEIQGRSLAPAIMPAVANFYTEAAQVAILNPNEQSLFWNTPRETIKDYCFALAGAAIYMAMQKRKRIDS